MRTPNTVLACMKDKRKQSLQLQGSDASLYLALASPQLEYCSALGSSVEMRDTLENSIVPLAARRG